MAKKTLDDLEVEGARVLCRLDLNVPLTEGAEGPVVADDFRLEASLPTIRELRRRGARTVLCAHLGRPGGRPDDRWSMAPVARRLEELLETPVRRASDCVGLEVERSVTGLEPGEVLLLENLRFHPGEKADDPSFASDLASLGDVFCQDAFGACHREHASIVGLPPLLPSAAGRLLRAEMEAILPLTREPEPPYVGIFGGAKVSTKARLLERLVPRLDACLIGGAMAFTFLRARDVGVGESLVEEDLVDLAGRILELAEEHGTDVVLPRDVVCVTAEEFAAVREGGEVPEGPPVVHPPLEEDQVGLDVGPETVSLFTAWIARARTLVWNGPLGLFERRPFEVGTHGIAQAVADADARTVIGGGETADAVRDLDLADRVGHVSTGGGAFVSLLTDGTLPGIEALPDREGS